MKKKKKKQKSLQPSVLMPSSHCSAAVAAIPLLKETVFKKKSIGFINHVYL